MADTGAPWNIPFAEPSDLVRDWPALSEDVAEAVAAGLTDLDTAIDNIPVLAGIGSNVVQAVTTGSFTTSSTSYEDVTGLEVSITPSSDTSKVLVIITGQGGAASTATGLVQLLRDSTVLAESDQVLGCYLFMHHGGDLHGTALNFAFLDSPGKDTAVVYKLRLRRLGGSGNVFVGRTDLRPEQQTCSITAIEVAP